MKNSTNLNFSQVWAIASKILGISTSTDETYTIKKISNSMKIEQSSDMFRENLRKN